MQDTGTRDNEILMTSDAARELEVAKETILAWERAGKLRAMRTTNGRRLFLRSEIERVKRERAGAQTLG